MSSGSPDDAQKHDAVTGNASANVGASKREMLAQHLAANKKSAALRDAAVRAIVAAPEPVDVVSFLGGWMPGMFVLARAVAYAALFIGVLLVFVPARILSAAGIIQPSTAGVWQIAGMLVAAVGAALALTCIFTFAVVGRGTPAPFDPPRRLVVRGPYRLLRNPMYAGAGLALSGAALYHQSVALLGYAGAFLVVMHMLVVLYEEPTLRRMFGTEYEAYCQQAGRWWPTR